jgi:hypothetical protein
MRNRFYRTVLVAVTASLLTAGTALARSAEKSSRPKSGQIDVIYPSKIAAGPELQPGTYTVELGEHASSPEIMFYQNGKLVGQAPAQLVDNGKKTSETEVDYDTAGNERVITEIRLRGWTQKVVFNPSASAETQPGS